MDQWEKLDVNDYVTDQQNSKPESIASNSYVNDLYKTMGTPPSKDGLIKIALMSDIHVDYDYTEGASNTCDKPLCCRSDSGNAKDASTFSGKWGDYNCDIPAITLENMLSFIKNEIQPDAVLWGGDSVPHNLDTLSLKTNVDIIKNVTS